MKTNKTDAADAEGIWEAAQRPGMRFVALMMGRIGECIALNQLLANFGSVACCERQSSDGPNTDVALDGDNG